MNKEIVIVLPGLIIDDHNLSEFIIKGLKFNNKEVLALDYNTCNSFLEAQAYADQIITEQINLGCIVNIICIGSASIIKLSQEVNSYIMISPILDDHNIELPTKNILDIDFYKVLTKEIDYDWYDHISPKKLLINGMKNKYLSHLDSTVFAKNYQIEYLGLEEMEYDINEYYNREFIVEHMIEYISK